jgi:sigma-B regulation protein RsbU (phosphoserine phosphatase)
MDTIFFLGDDSPQIPLFLEKLGYAVLRPAEASSVSDIVARNTLDLIVIDGRVASDVVDLCAFFRSQESTRGVPIVCVSPPDRAAQQRLELLDKLELVPQTFSVGTLASKIATQLRLRKTVGSEEGLGTLAEINAALRDHNARFKKDLEEARSIQQNLLPQKLPKDPRFQIAVSYHPLEDVGGDWYAVDFDKDKEELQLHIADVSGHGLPAALLASMAKLAMVAAERTRPDEILGRINYFLLPQLPTGRFMTIGHALYRPDSGQLLWSRAGHGPALLRRAATREVVQLMGDGFPIGFVPDATYQLIEERLLPGDCIVLFTDGLTEAQNRAMEQFGIDRLCAAISELPENLRAGEMVGRIVDALSDFLEDRMLKDDVTLVLLKREL